MNEIKILLKSKSFDYKKGLELYHKYSTQVKILPSIPTDSDINRLKLLLQAILDSHKNPAETMSYYELKAAVIEFDINVNSLKKEDLHKSLYDYYEKQGY